MVQDYLTTGRGCYTSGCIGGNVCVGALLPEWALVFFNVMFLGCIEDIFAYFFFPNQTWTLFLIPIYCCRFWLEIGAGTD